MEGIAAPNQRIEPMTRSAVMFILDSTSVDALLVMAHPRRSA
jgi:hypothetical protein